MHLHGMSCAAAIFLAAPALGGITRVDDARQLLASANAIGGGGMDSDADGPLSPAPFADWDASASALASVPQAGGSASAVQLSHLRSDLILAQGGASASASALGGTSASESLNIFDMTFRLTETSDILLIASTSSVRNGQITLELTSSTGSVLFSGSGIFDTTLAAGRYRLFARAHANASAPDGQGGSAGYALQFITVPGASTAGLLTAALLCTRRRR